MRAGPPSPGPMTGGAERGRFEPAALVALGALTAVWCWWAGKSGGYFITVLLPGSIALCAVLAVLAWVAPWRGSLVRSRPTLVGASALLALAAWAALSALWSPAPELAIQDGQRILVYAVAFALGVWLCDLLGDRRDLALVPLAAAGAFAGTLAVVGMLTGDDPRHYLDVDGTLGFPLGYRNANAAFFLIAFWPAIGLAARRDGHWIARGAANAAATLCLGLGLLCQSRGSILAGAAALCVYVLARRDLGRALVWLMLAAIPAALVIPALTDLYGAAGSGNHLGSVTDELRAAGRAVAASTAIALVIGALAARLEGRLPASRRRGEVANRAAALGLVSIVVAGSIAFLVAVGNPIDWVGQRVAEFRSGREFNGGADSSRFTFDAHTGRIELWRVALVDAGDHPLLGDGAGGYRYSYLRERRNANPPQVRDAHSVELENLSELGVPGLLLFGLAGAGIGAGVLRARANGPGAAALSAVALAAGAYWLVHSSLDWFWPYPGVTAPVFALLGSASAPALRGAREPPRGQGRRLLVAGAAALAVSAIPPFLSQRYIDNAYSEWRADPTRAYQDLDRARSLNPLSIDPLLAEGAIAKANGDRSRAVDAFRRAADQRPDEWVTHYFLALLYRDGSPRLARQELAAAKRRNPRSAEVLALERKLGSSGRLSAG